MNTQLEKEILLKKTISSTPKRFLNLRIALSQIPYSLKITIFILILSVILSVNVGLSEAECKQKCTGFNAYNNEFVKRYYYSYRAKTGRDYFIDTAILTYSPILKNDVSKVPLVLNSPLSYIFMHPRYASGPFTYSL